MKVTIPHLMVALPILALILGASGAVSLPGVMYVATGQPVVVVVVNSTSQVLYSTITGFGITQIVSSTSTGLATATSTTTNYQTTSSTSQSTTQVSSTITSTVTATTTSSPSTTSSATTSSTATSTLTTQTTVTSVTTSGSSTITYASTGTTVIMTTLGGAGAIGPREGGGGHGTPMKSWIQLDPSTGRTVVILPLDANRSLIMMVEVFAALVTSIIVGVIFLYRQKSVN